MINYLCHNKVSHWFPTVLTIICSMVSGVLLCNSSQQPQLVDIKSLAPAISVRIPYATENNFTGKKLYSRNVCLLRPAVANAVLRAYADALSHGFSLRLMDCYRPQSVSLDMWRVGEEHNRACRRLGGACRSGNCNATQPNCLWEPLTNFMSRASKHNRAATVDITLITLYGTEVNMGTAFDYFGPEARTSNASGKALEHRILLKNIMHKQGFRNYFREWWHYDHQTYQDYAVLDLPLDSFTGRNK